ncbi:glycosyltransferase [Actinokineospora inagensis]|uniref:glycosyltransferase n=1 Tax=Actinokineospora inagensis TaxID=103730 RepID=UPI000423E035|nr:glycosyltransferase [Actinokineospora inagensis]
MKILFNSLPAHGHTYPLLPLAIAAKQAGHEISYATWDNFQPTLEKLGFEFIRAGGDMRAAFATAAGTEVRSASQFDKEESSAIARRVFGEVMPRQTIADLRPVVAARRFDLVVYESAAFGGGITARLEGVPAVSHGITKGTALVEALGEFLPPLLAEQEVDFGFTDPYLDIYPASLVEPVAGGPLLDRVPLRPVPFAEGGALPDWVADHPDKLIYLTLGTAFGNPRVLTAAIQGLAATGHRVLVAAGPTVSLADLGDPPSNVTVQPWVPQAELLPHVDLVVHHGGSGTTLGSAAAGVPQLFLPQGADQFDNAETFTGAGAARQLLGDDVNPDAITETASALLTDEAIAKAVATLADEIADMPSPADIAARLPEWA